MPEVELRWWRGADKSIVTSQAWENHLINFLHASIDCLCNCITMASFLERIKLTKRDSSRLSESTSTPPPLSMPPGVNAGPTIVSISRFGRSSTATGTASPHHSIYYSAAATPASQTPVLPDISALPRRVSSMAKTTTANTESHMKAHPADIYTNTEATTSHPSYPSSGGGSSSGDTRSPRRQPSSYGPDGKPRGPGFRTEPTPPKDAKPPPCHIEQYNPLSRTPEPSRKGMPSISIGGDGADDAPNPPSAGSHTPGPAVTERGRRKTRLNATLAARALGAPRAVMERSASPRRTNSVASKQRSRSPRAQRKYLGRSRKAQSAPASAGNAAAAAAPNPSITVVMQHQSVVAITPLLKQAIALTAMLQPADPIAYLAHFLNATADRKEAENAERERRLEEDTMAILAAARIKAEKEAALKKRTREAAARVRRNRLVGIFVCLFVSRALAQFPLWWCQYT